MMSVPRRNKITQLTQSLLMMPVLKKNKKNLQLVTENVTGLTKETFNNNSSSTLTENNTESSKKSRHCKLCNTNFQISRAILNDLPNPLNTFCNSCYLESINSLEIDKSSPKIIEEGEKN